MSAPTRASWWAAAAMAAIALAGFAARAWRLALPGLTSDEAFSWRLTRYPAGEMLHRAALDVHPPLYYLTLKAWLIALGEAPAVLRGFSVLMGVVAIVLVFLLVQEAARLEDGEGRPAALLAAALLALHATQVLQSRNARMYALGTVLSVLSAWLVLRARRAAAVLDAGHGPLSGSGEPVSPRRIV